MVRFNAPYTDKSLSTEYFHSLFASPRLQIKIFSELSRIDLCITLCDGPYFLEREAMANKELLRVFIGADPRQPVSYNVLQNSIVRRSSKPIQITPLILHQLPITRKGLTEFTFSRFLVPWLCDYQGWALFLDADILVTDDIAKLFAYRDSQYDIMVIKNPQKVEWPSVMLFNCEKCKILTPEFIQHSEEGLLFALKWAGELAIGELPLEWNHLVGYSPKRRDASLIHYTQGAPMFPEIGNCEYSSDWLQEHLHMNSFETWKEILGPSFHGVWLAGERVPRLTIDDLNERVIAQINSNPKPIFADSDLPSDKAPSKRYQTRLHAFTKLHLLGDVARNLLPAQTFLGTNMFKVMKPLTDYVLATGPKSLLDYGSGKAIQYAPVTVDTPDGQKHERLKNYLALDSITCYDPAYPPLAKLPMGNFDIVVCIDVLDRIPEPDLPWVLEELVNRSYKHLFVKVCGYDNGITIDEGEAESCTVKSVEWWCQLFGVLLARHPEIELKLLYEERDGSPLLDLSQVFERPVTN